MRHPIQRLHTCLATARLYTGTSNTLQVFDVSSGALLSSWTAPQLLAPGKPATTTPKTTADDNEETNPKKKRKVEDMTASPKATKKEQKKEKKEKKKSAIRGGVSGGIETHNAITKILTTGDGKYVVVATTDDKAITVFSTEGGNLGIQSVRHLPKRIVDLALVEDSSKIICADKFGDVFGIPLFPPASDSKSIPHPTTSTSFETATPDIEMSSAEERPPGKYENEAQWQRHLEKQRANIAREQAAAERRKRLNVDYNIPFTHDFILGHVSMLLSLITITLPADHPKAGGREKTWVITGDRDEHIRITRYPQSFVIEGFCLGHTQFVKKMLAPSWDLTSLISGGGDEYLLVWNWKERKVIQKLDLVAPVQAVLGPETKIFVPKTGEKGEAEAEDEEGMFKFAVSGLWEVPSIRGIMVGIESVPALFLFTSTPEGLKYTSTLSLPGNFLDAAVSPADNKVFVSVDPASATKPMLGVYTLDNTGQWAGVDEVVARNVERSVVETVDLSEQLMAAVTPNVIYPVGSLRKEYGIRDKED